MSSKEKQGTFSILRRLLSYFGKNKKMMGLSVLCALAQVVLTLFAPRIMGKCVDLLVTGQVDFPLLGKTVLLLLVVYLSASFLGYIAQFLVGKASYRTVEALRKEAFEKIKKLPISAVDHTPHGDLTARIAQDADAVSEGLISVVSQLVTGVFTILGTLLFLFLSAPLIAGLVLVLTPLSILVARFITGRSQTLFALQQKSQGAVSAFVSERVGLLKLCRQFHAEEETMRGFEEENEALRRYGYKAQLYASLINPLTRFVNHLVYIAAGTAGVILFFRGQITVGTISACLTYTESYTKPFNEISSVFSQMQTALSGLDRIFEFLDFPEQSDDSHLPQAGEMLNADVQFQDVSFGYEENHILLHNMFLQVKAGQKCAIVGPTGAGKTTLVNLLMRFYDVNGGKIELGGQNIACLNRASLRGRFGMVLQESFLFQGTVRENLLIGNPDATDAELEDALRKAHAWSFVRRLPEGMNTRLSGSEALSEGQKQLLCIARVMLHNPDILILDEATSAIDSRTEQKIAAAFDDMMLARTSFVVAHRLSTIRSADRIVVLKDGDICEQGSHEELIRKNGFYKQLYERQFGGAYESA